MLDTRENKGRKSGGQLPLRYATAYCLAHSDAKEQAQKKKNKRYKGKTEEL